MRNKSKLKKEPYNTKTARINGRKKYTRPKIDKLGKLKNITMGASLVGTDTFMQLMT